MPPLTVLAILGIFAVLAFVVCRLEGLTVFAPKSTQWVRGAAQQFCLDRCRTPEGKCPLALDPDACPMWQFIQADVRTDQRIDPHRPVGVVV